MKLTFEPMRLDWAREAASWQYGGELSFYNGFHAPDELMDKGYFAALNGCELAGYFVAGEEARVPGFPYDDRCVDVGLRLRPELVGRGKGRDFVRQGVEFLAAGRDVRLTVAAFNGRALKVYAGVGFEIEDSFVAPTGVRFFVMARRLRRWIDLSLPLDGHTAPYPGDERFQMRQQSLPLYRLSGFTMSAHSGTHVDAPSHFHLGGNVRDLSIEAMIGPALVGEIGDLGRFKPGFGRFLLKTDRGLEVSEAERLVALGAKLVGVGRISVGPYEAEAPVHRVLLGAGAVVLENLNLAGVADGIYDLCCLPINAVDAEAAPARAAIRLVREMRWGDAE
ncbi:MAG: hypothetical protein GX558_11215 [Clostridiales bacterium]|nr:hypothetical protein [Clostridiales bacterium]